MTAEEFRYKIIHGLLSAIARLPFGALYALSGLVAPVLGKIVRYRRNVVRGNLEAAFPEMSEKALRRTEREFYRNFTDYVVETLKLLHISDREIERRMQFEGREEIAAALENGRDVLIYFSHSFNWEWATSFVLHMPESVGGRIVSYGQVYRPLRNRVFDRLMLTVRSRFSSHSYAKHQVLRDLLRFRRAGEPTVTGFMSDQKPSHGDPTYPALFLGRPTAFISGTETLARKLDMSVFYWDMIRLGRGRYKIVCRSVADSAAAAAPGEITEKYVRLLEATIRRCPSNWLWSHKKWKKV